VIGKNVRAKTVDGKPINKILRLFNML